MVGLQKQERHSAGVAGAEQTAITKETCCRMQNTNKKGTGRFVHILKVTGSVCIGKKWSSWSYLAPEALNMSAHVSGSKNSA